MPGAATPAAALDPDERLEDALPVLDRDARAVVGDVDLDLVAHPPDADAHAFGARGVLRFVLEQLLEDLAEPRLVADRDVRVGRADPSGSGAGEAGAEASRRSRRPPPPHRTGPATGWSAPRRGPRPGSSRPGGPAGRAGRRRRRATSAPRPGRRPLGVAAAASASRSTYTRTTDSGVRSSWVTTDRSSARAASRAVSWARRASTSAVSRPFSTMPASSAAIVSRNAISLVAEDAARRGSGR